MPMYAFTTQIETFNVAREVEGEPSISDDDIERAIDEIQMAIKKYSK